MATLAQIEAKSTATLTTTERNHARRVLGQSPDLTLAQYAAMEVVFDTLTSARNQEARAILADWDAIPQQRVEKSGGSKGITYRTLDDRYDTYAQMSRLLGLAVDSYDVWAEAYIAAGAQMVTITLGGMYAVEGDEYA